MAKPTAHEPCLDDGALYCGWNTGTEILNGCGHVWPCPTIQAQEQSSKEDIKDEQQQARADVEPPEGSFVLVDEDAVWVRDDQIADSDFVNPDFHWWQMDGGSWLVDPMSWQQLKTKAWVQLVRVDPKKKTL